MTDTAPDVNVLINFLNALAIDFECDDEHDAKETCDKAAAALRTLQEKNEALNEECDASMETIALERARAEAAEKRVDELELMLRSANSLHQKTSTSMTDWVRRAEAAEAKLAALQDEWNNCDEMLQACRASLVEAMKVIEPFAKVGELFPNASPDENAYDPCIYLPAAGDEYALKGSHLRAARKFLKENGNGE